MTIKFEIPGFRIFKAQLPKIALDCTTLTKILRIFNQSFSIILL